MKKIFKTWTTAIASLSCSLIATSLFTIWVKPSYGRELENIFSGRNIPLSLQLNQLNNSWRKITISGTISVQFEEFINIIKATSGSFLSNFGNTDIYYTEGKVAQIGNDTYLIAYRAPNSVPQLNPSMMFGYYGDSSDPCSDEFMPKPLTPQTPLSLSLLNLDTVGAFQDIIPVDVSAEIANSVQQYESAIAFCQNTQNQISQDEAMNYVGAMNRGQQAYYLEYSKFSSSLEELYLGIPMETEHYRYSVVQQNESVLNYAIAKNNSMVSYVGAVFPISSPDNNDYTTQAIVCAAETPGSTRPNAPFLENNQAICGSGTTNVGM